jgi:hypothetical protein
MTTGDYAVTFYTLRELAAPFGVSISRQWVSKYIRKGLLPPQQSPGLGRGKGRLSLYTIGLSQQLPSLLRALDKHGKNLNAVGWELWWLGYYVAPKYWSPRLSAVAIQFNRVRALALSYQAGDHNAEALLQQIKCELRTKKDAGKLIGSVKRHAPDQLEDFLAIVLSVISGDYIPLSESSYDQYEMDRLTKLFGGSLSIPAKDSDILVDNRHFSASVEGLDGQLAIMAGLLSVDCEKAVSEMSDQEIAAARQELAIFLFGISAVERGNMNAYGETSGAKSIVWLNASATSQAIVLVGWLLRRTPKLIKNISQINKAIVDQIELAKEKTK